jgi:hypothetical protein
MDDVQAQPGFRHSVGHPALKPHFTLATQAGTQKVALKIEDTMIAKGF